MDDERKVYSHAEGPNQRNRPNQLQTHNLPTDDVKNIHTTIRMNQIEARIDKSQQNSNVGYMAIKIKVPMI